MTFARHGLSIGIERIEGTDFFIALKAVGKLSHEDYVIITPMIDSALAEVQQPKAKVLLDASQLEGWEPRAAWDDFKLGLKHGREFEKIAIYGNRDWQRMAARVGAWFVSGDIRYFETEQDAIAWLCNKINE